MTEPARKSHSIDLDALEQELAPLMPKRPDRESGWSAERAIQPDIGKLSAEAVLKQYDQTAKDVEALGVTVKEWVGKLDAALVDLNDNLKLIGEAAQHVRAKGDAVHALIAEATSVSKIIRDTCADFTKKVVV
jgi:ribonuclease HII